MLANTTKALDNKFFKWKSLNLKIQKQMMYLKEKLYMNSKDKMMFFEENCQVLEELVHTLLVELKPTIIDIHQHTNKINILNEPKEIMKGIMSMTMRFLSTIKIRIKNYKEELMSF